MLSGCPNTPGKGVRYCKMHEGLARSNVDEGNIMEGEGGKRVTTDEELVIQPILSNKVTRQGNFCEVKGDWCKGRLVLRAEARLFRPRLNCILYILLILGTLIVTLVPESLI
jgi:hypothetical protein